MKAAKAQTCTGNFFAIFTPAITTLDLASQPRLSGVLVLPLRRKRGLVRCCGRR